MKQLVSTGPNRRMIDTLTETRRSI